MYPVRIIKLRRIAVLLNVAILALALLLRMVMHLPASQISTWKLITFVVSIPWVVFLVLLFLSMLTGRFYYNIPRVTSKLNLLFLITLFGWFPDISDPVKSWIFLLVTVFLSLTTLMEVYLSDKYQVSATIIVVLY
jgi:hypothetical protein